MQMIDIIYRDGLSDRQINSFTQPDQAHPQRSLQAWLRVVHVFYGKICVSGKNMVSYRKINISYSNPTPDPGPNLKTRSGPTDPALELEILFWSPGVSDPALDPQIQPWSLRSSPGASDQVLESQIQP